MYDFRFDAILKVSNLTFLLEGAVFTIYITLAAMVLGTVVGLIAAIIRLSRLPVLSQLAVAYIEFFRGTPPLVQIMWFYFVLPMATGYDVPAIVSGTIALGLNVGAFLAEVFRAGIQAVPKGHIEAAESLSMTPLMIMRRIVLPQAIRIIIPAYGNYFISLVKDSALVSVIAVGELMRHANELNSQTYLPIEVYTVAAVIYFAMTYSVSQLMLWVERRLRIRRTAG